MGKGQETVIQTENGATHVIMPPVVPLLAPGVFGNIYGVTDAEIRKRINNGERVLKSYSNGTNYKGISNLGFN